MDVDEDITYLNTVSKIYNDAIKYLASRCE